jgi:hypothetical protein
MRIGESTSPNVGRLDSGGGGELPEERRTTPLGPVMSQIECAALR